MSTPPKPPRQTDPGVAAHLAKFNLALQQPVIAGFAGTSSSRTTLTSTRDPSRRVVFVGILNVPGAQPRLAAARMPEPWHDSNNIFAVLLGSPKGVRVPDGTPERAGVDAPEGVLREAMAAAEFGDERGKVPVGELPGAGWVAAGKKASGTTRVALFAPTEVSERGFGDWEMAVVTLQQVTDDPEVWTPRGAWDAARAAGLLRQPGQEGCEGMMPLLVVCSTLREEREEGVVFVG